MCKHHFNLATQYEHLGFYDGRERCGQNITNNVSHIVAIFNPSIFTKDVVTIRINKVDGVSVDLWDKTAFKPTKDFILLCQYQRIGQYDDCEIKIKVNV